MDILPNVRHEFFDKFSTFILDIWGVIHKSGVLYPGAIESLDFLKKSGKSVLLLSNAPYPAKRVVSLLSSLGVKMDEHYQCIMTSGEHFLMEVKSSGSMRVLHVGPNSNLDLFRLPGVEVVTDHLDADYGLAVLTAPLHQTSFADGFHLEQEEEIFKVLLSRDIRLVCINPDKFVNAQNGELVPCAGYAAEHFEKMGGDVHYIGKPAPDIYCALFDMAGEAIPPDPESVIMIGDSIETDIRGALNFGITTPCLCLSGMAGRSLGYNFSEHDVDNLLKKHNISNCSAVMCL